MKKLKLKTHKGAQKRFKKTASGNYKRGQSHQRHILTSKSPKRKRQLDIATTASKADNFAIKEMLPYA
jgi:large subunit ribosomal protein L35